MAREDRLPASRSEGRAMNPFDMLHSHIDRIFNDFGSGIGFPRSFGEETMRMPSLWGEGRVIPSLELHEAEGRMIVTAELPGVDEKDIDISVDDQLLTISGEKKSEVEQKDGDNYRSERSYGKFSRSITLPFAIDPEKVDARFDKGVLKLTIEKPADTEQKARRIAIRH